MAILIGPDTRLLVQGITGGEGRFHTRLMRQYGTQVVAGVTPGRGGMEVEGVPVFDTVERAVGETLACGTGACATAVAARLLGHSGDEVEVRQPGGSVTVAWRPGEQILLTGPTEEVFRGRWLAGPG